jgi:hypothetical protein
MLHRTIEVLWQNEMWRVQPLLWKNWVNKFPWKRIRVTVELWFLRGPCRGIIKSANKIVWSSWLSRCQPARIWAWEQRNWTEELRYQNYWAQFSGVECLGVKRRLCVCYSTGIFGVCNYSETVMVPVLKSVTRKQLVESVTAWRHYCACNGEL